MVPSSLDLQHLSTVRNAWWSTCLPHTKTRSIPSMALQYLTLYLRKRTSNTSGFIVMYTIHLSPLGFALESHQLSNVLHWTQEKSVCSYVAHQEWFSDLLELLMVEPLQLYRVWDRLVQLLHHKFHNVLDTLNPHGWKLNSESSERERSFCRGLWRWR